MSSSALAERSGRLRRANSAISRRVVVGVDDRPQARDAPALGAAVAEALGAPLIVASVYSSEGLLTPAPAEELRAEAERTPRTR